jgi:hypothetical protein
MPLQEKMRGHIQYAPTKKMRADTTAPWLDKTLK